MFETPERATITTEKKGNTSYDYVIRFRNARKNLLKRAESLKGKDETRRKELINAAERMGKVSKGKKGLSTAEVHRNAVIAEINLLVDEHKHREGKANGKK